MHLNGCTSITPDNRRFLLTSTRVKLLNAYEQTSDYIKRLQVEYDKLNKEKDDIASNTNNTSRQLIADRLSALDEILNIHNKIISIKNEISELESYVNSNKKEVSGSTAREEDEMMKIVKQDLIDNNTALNELKMRFVDELVGEQDSEDQENALMEISAGVGGQEAMLFCLDLYQMYQGYATFRGWYFENLVYEKSDIGGLRHASVNIKGEAVFKYLKYESGVHRVQRVPKTERTGRIHTSTVGVIILPKPEEITIELPPKDLKFESCRSSGPGGQHVNKTESAIRITHLPTGVTVFCQDERHQYMNRKKALETLKYKLYQKQYEDSVRDRESNRRSQVSSASRSERIRTYNFVQDRVTDHRINDNIHNINEFLLGEDNLHDLILSLNYENSLDLLFNKIIK